MSQVLISVMAWFLMHSGISIPEFPALADTGFNQPVACQFDFASNCNRTTGFPAVNQREQLRGVLVIVELPIQPPIVPGVGYISKPDVVGSQEFWNIFGFSPVASIARDSLFQISDLTQTVMEAAQYWTFRSVAYFFHPVSRPMKNECRNPVQDFALLVKNVDVERIVDRIYSTARRLSSCSVGSTDDYWNYYRDCDRWGVVLKRMMIEPVPASANAETGRIVGTVANQVRMALRVLVPGSVEFDLLTSNRESLLEVSRTALEWWQLVVCEGLKPSISAMIYSRMIW